jgi:hypothetical protein
VVKKRTLHAMSLHHSDTILHYKMLTINYQLSTKKIMENKQSIWGKILNIVITVLTAIATTFGVTSCMGV